MNKKILITGAAIAAAVVLAAVLILTVNRQPSTVNNSYTCPMHPEIRHDRPGSCPICGMDLVMDESQNSKVKSQNGDPVEGRAEIHISHEKQAQIGIRSEEAAIRPMEKEISASGTVAYDPEMYYAQQEYIAAYKNSKQGIKAADSLLENSAIKLQSLGFSKAQIKELESRDAPDKSLLINEGGSGAWVYAQVFQEDISFIERGQKAVITGRGIKGGATGTVVAIDPVLNPQTRSVRVRILVREKLDLRQESFVDVRITAKLGNMLSVPEDAVIDTGKITLVYVDKGDGHFEPRRVMLGGKASGYYMVEDGLFAGESVVVNANFLVDSESRLKAK